MFYVTNQIPNVPLNSFLFTDGKTLRFFISGPAAARRGFHQIAKFHDRRDAELAGKVNAERGEILVRS